MGYSTGDCKARSCLWLACKHRENSAFEFFDQTGEFFDQTGGRWGFLHIPPKRCISAIT